MNVFDFTVREESRDDLDPGFLLPSPRVANEATAETEISSRTDSLRKAAFLIVASLG